MITFDKVKVYVEYQFFFLIQSTLGFEVTKHANISISCTRMNVFLEIHFDGIIHLVSGFKFSFLVIM